MRHRSHIGIAPLGLDMVTSWQMSTVAEIQAALPQLTTHDLIQVEQALHAIYRQRKTGLIFDDAYGAVTEADLIASAEEAFLAYDKEEDGARSLSSLAWAPGWRVRCARSS
jgi:hypothetical protein